MHLCPTRHSLPHPPLAAPPQPMPCGCRATAASAPACPPTLWCSAAAATRSCCPDRSLTGCAASCWVLELCCVGQQLLHCCWLMLGQVELLWLGRAVTHVVSAMVLLPRVHQASAAWPIACCQHAPPLLQVVVRDGRPISEAPPPYEELDYVPAAIKSGALPSFAAPAAGLVLLCPLVADSVWACPCLHVGCPRLLVGGLQVRGGTPPAHLSPLGGVFC